MTTGQGCLLKTGVQDSCPVTKVLGLRWLQDNAKLSCTLVFLLHPFWESLQIFSFLKGISPRDSHPIISFWTKEGVQDSCPVIGFWVLTGLQDFNPQNSNQKSGTSKSPNPPTQASNLKPQISKSQIPNH